MFKRFASDEANSSEEKSSVNSADGEQGSVQSAIDSATTYASESAESVANSAEQAKDAVTDAATGAAAAAGIAFQPREDRRESRPSNGDRDGGYGGRERRLYDNNNRGSDRGGYGADRGGERRPYQDRRDRPERVLTPTTGVYVGNLLFDITGEDLQREFGQYGNVKSTVVATDARGLSKGYVWFSMSPLTNINTDNCSTDSDMSNSRPLTKPKLRSKPNTSPSSKAAVSL